MINNWKTKTEIIKEYGLLGHDFAELADECHKGKFRKAVIVIQGTGRKYVYVNEDLWQKFLLDKAMGNISQKQSPHLVEVKQ